MAAIDGKILLTNNDCYKRNARMIPRGIVVHSTGCENPNLKRYIAPDDGTLGKNDYGNDWNRGGLDVCVHAFIGKNKNGEVKTYQTLPFDVCCWGCGGGWNGSYNYDPPYIQFEMCEDDLTDKSYCLKCYNKAVELCAHLCKVYNLSPSNIVSHREAYLKGYASQHGDPHNWWDRFGLTMDGFRADVANKLTNRVFKVKDKCRLYAKPYKDPVGHSVASFAIVKGTELKLLGEAETAGWSKVSYKGKRLYIMNKYLPLSKLSPFAKVKLARNRRARIVLSSGKLGKIPRTLKKGTEIKIIGKIIAGKYKGYKLVKVGDKSYYLKSAK